MRSIKMIIVHASDTPKSMDIGVEKIRKWHTDPKPMGNGWSDIGYHYVIRRDGTQEDGRPLDQVGSHVRGFNSHSIGICLVGGRHGKFDFNIAQLDSLADLVDALQEQFGRLRLRGHCDYDRGKTCPNFDVEALLSD